MKKQNYHQEYVFLLMSRSTQHYTCQKSNNNCEPDGGDDIKSTRRTGPVGVVPGVCSRGRQSSHKQNTHSWFIHASHTDGRSVSPTLTHLVTHSLLTQLTSSGDDITVYSERCDQTEMGGYGRSWQDGNVLTSWDSRYTRLELLITLACKLQVQCIFNICTCTN